MRAMLDRVRVIARAIKQIPAAERGPMQEALRRYMRQNAGVRGTAAVRERDWLMSLLTGRQWAIYDEQGRQFWPMASLMDVSDWLDHTGPRLGSMLMRGQDEWLPSHNCHPKSVLMYTAPGTHTMTCPAASLPDRANAIGGY